MHREFNRVCCENRILLGKAIHKFAIQCANTHDYEDMTDAFFLENEGTNCITCDGGTEARAFSVNGY